MSRVDVDYALDDVLRQEIKRIKESILDDLDGVEIYLFGSVAKGRYTATSDIDLLILMQTPLEPREIRKLKHKLEDKLEQLYLSRHVDLKIYHHERYKVLCQTPCFEQCIQKDLICLRGW